MDINAALNEVIFKYHLDRYYPHYRNMYEAERILCDIISEIKRDNRKAVFVGDDKTGIAFIQNIVRDYKGIRFLFYNRYDTELKNLESVNLEDCEVYLTSFYGAEYIERWFRVHEIQYKWIYDIFGERGYFLQREFFVFGKEDLLNLVAPREIIHDSRIGYTESIQCELYCQQNKYENTDNAETKRIALEKSLFLSLYMRNFVEARKYIPLLTQYDSKFEKVWDEIQNLLHMAKEAIVNKNQKDIIMYWLDALPYGDEKNMPYLQSVFQNSVVFDNAFTYIPYTHSALRAMFLGKKDIDDQAYRIKNITIENSPVIQFLEERGYHIKVFSGYLNDSIPFDYQSDRFYIDGYVPCSLKLWDMLSEMLLESEKTLWLVHAMDTHFPFLNSMMRDNNYHDKKVRQKQVRLEIDELLAFYESFISKESVRIYMSDHGKKYGAIHEDFHVVFSIYKRSLEPRRVQGLFSLLDFGTVLKQIIMEENIKEEDFVREYIEVGNMDRYSFHDLQALFQNKKELSLLYFGYKGIIDQDYIYIHYRTGKEWLARRNDVPACNPLLFLNCDNDICNSERLGYYRNLAGEYPVALEQDDKFKYSKYLYYLYDNILRQSNVKERIDKINQLIADYPAASVAIRTGGIHSATLYYVLTQENKAKIWGFIDDDNECQCSRLPLPVAHTSQIEKIKKEGVMAIVLSSYDYLDILRKESRKWPKEIAILDIYSWLEENGIMCTGNFYRPEIIETDYDVGFPFG